MQLFVDTDYKGHHSEYLDIIIEYHLKNNIKAAFIVHPTFLKNRAGLIDNRNILIFEYQCSNSLKDKYIEFKFINNIISNNSISECCLLNFNYYFKIFPLISGNKAFKGIYFMPYLNKEKLDFKEKFTKYLYFKIILFLHNKSSFFILNDKKSVLKFNRYFKTNAFKYLIDPVYTINKIKKNKLLRTDNFINFSFLGEISPRKGIFHLLKALNNLPHLNLYKINVTIAGNPSIYKDKILIEIDKLNEKHPNLFKEVLLERITDDKFEELLYASDIVFCLHQVVEGSSGILGKAALFSKPVIGPNKGLIGELIDEYKLGIQIDTTVVEQIIYAINKAILLEDSLILRDCQKYVDEHSPDKFVKTLIK